MAKTIYEAEQVRLSTVLKDPIYRKWFAKVPYLPPASRSGNPWYLYLQKEQDGNWSRAGFSTYAKAYGYVVSKAASLYDFAIVSRRKTYLPPVYRPKIDGEPAKHKVYWANYPSNHNWCPYCRRPTIFREFVSHSAVKEVHKIMGVGYMAPQIRCTICGIREEGVKQWLNLGRSPML